MNDKPAISPLSVCTSPRLSGTLMGVVLSTRVEAALEAPRTNCVRLPGSSRTTRWPCALSLHAQSISTSAWDVLRSATGTARVLGHFRRAVDLLIGDEVLALVLPEAGNGPLNVVVTPLPDAPLPRHVDLTWTQHTLHVGPWQVYFDTATWQWNPRPPWETLTINPARLAQLHDLALHETVNRATTGSPFVGLLMGQPFPLVTALGCALAANDTVALHAAAAAIAGLGPGLTPSGDDFLAGVMLGMRMRNREIGKSGNQQIGKLSNHHLPSNIQHHGSCFLHPASCIFAAAAPRTTRLSRAFLRAASRGLADEHWQRLLAALSAENPAQLEHAATHVLNHGASSGLDMVAGFLWQLKAL